MKVEFKDQELPIRRIKVNKNIQDVIEKYRHFQAKMRDLASDYRAVISNKESLEKAHNPWVYFQKGILKREVESGVSVMETAFNFGAMKLKNEKPTDVINAAFYTNKTRNDSDFEIGYLLPLFYQVSDNASKALVVNPSPDMISELEANKDSLEICYAVTDSVIAKLYSLQFPGTEFRGFQEVDSFSNVDLLLIVNRDQKCGEMPLLLRSLGCCSMNAEVILFSPTAWLDNPKYNVSSIFQDEQFYISQILVLDTNATHSSPRKKAITFLSKDSEEYFDIWDSKFDLSTRLFSVSKGPVARLKSAEYLESKKTIIQMIKESKNPVKVHSVPKYSKSIEYRFSKEISIFYRIYNNRKNKWAGTAFYREIVIDPKTRTLSRGRQLTGNIEKGLRASSEQEVIDSLESVVFFDRFYDIVYTDVFNKIIKEKEHITLKTVWFLCWRDLILSKQYDHKQISQLFKNESLANCCPFEDNGADILEKIASSSQIDIDSLSYKLLIQFNLIFACAVKRHLIIHNPIEPFVREYSKRATERQQDVRDALVKKHFSNSEEEIIFGYIVGKTFGKGQYKCTENSLLLATAIRLFTGMAIREVSALNWGDYKDSSLTITKIVDSSGNKLSHEKDNWKRFRAVPIAKALSHLLELRRMYLVNKGIDAEYLDQCPIVMSEERILDMRSRKRINPCKPEIIGKSERLLIQQLNIPENEIVLPDEKNELKTDFNRYHGDIFLSNFRHKANHTACLTMGELNYIIGIDAPDTFSRHYCDYSNDLVRELIVQKLRRWTWKYEILISNNADIKKAPSCGELEGNCMIETGPFVTGIPSVQLVVENLSGNEVFCDVESEHGFELQFSEYTEGCDEN